MKTKFITVEDIKNSRLYVEYDDEQRQASEDGNLAHFIASARNAREAGKDSIHGTNRPDRINWVAKNVNKTPEPYGV